MIGAKVTVVNNVAAVMQGMRDNIQDAVNEVALEAAEKLKPMVSTHKTGEWSQGASAESIYITIGTGGQNQSSYSSALNGFAKGFEDGELKKRGASTNRPSASDLSAIGSDDFAARAASMMLPRFILKKEPNKIKSAVSSCSKIVYFWEIGHENIFTRMFELHPSFTPLSMQMGGRLLAECRQAVSSPVMSRSQRRNARKSGGFSALTGNTQGLPSIRSGPRGG